MGTITALRTEATPALTPTQRIPIIKQHIEDGDKAGLAYYRAAGMELWAAKDDMEDREFWPWATAHFDRSREQLDKYMKLASRPPPRRREDGKDQTLSRAMGDSRPRHDLPIDYDKLKKGELERGEEREGIRKLKLEIIDIGYKVLAKTLHPDKRGGSRKAMTWLNEAKKELKAYVR